MLRDKLKKNAARTTGPLGIDCESWRHTHVFAPKLIKNFKFESEQAEQVNFILKR